MSYDVWVALVVVPILILVSLPILARQANRENDRALFWLLLAALVLKLGGALVRHHVAFEVYDKSDARGYHQEGLALAASFRAGDWGAIPHPLTDTNLMRFLTGVFYAVVGPSKLSLFLIFSWLGFWGLFFFYRAFRLAVPEGRGRSYARLLFFLPTLLYWPSSLGKEAWMLFGLGIAAFGVARIMTGRFVPGIVATGIGLWVTTLVRPYISAFIAMGLVAAYVARRPAQHSPLAPLAKVVVLAGLSAVAIFTVRNTESFLTESKIDIEEGVASVSREITERTLQGGSEFVPHPIVESPSEAPIAAFTVLYRPLITEAHNPPALLAALETSLLLLLTIVRLPWGFAALGSLRRQPYLAFAAVYVGLSIVALSILANFGILARQRSLLLPLFLAFLAVPPRRRGDEEPAPASAAEPILMGAK